MSAARASIYDVMIGDPTLFMRADVVGQGWRIMQSVLDATQTLKLILDRGLDAWVYTEDEWLIRDPDAPHVARETWTVKFDAKVVASFTDEHLAHAVKIVGVSDDLDLVAVCEKVAQNTLGEKASAARSQPYYLT